MPRPRPFGRVEGSTVFDRVAADEGLSAPADLPDLRGHVELALRSGFPTAALELAGAARAAWLDSYLDDLLTHDIAPAGRAGGRRRDPERLRRYLDSFTGQIDIWPTRR